LVPISAALTFGESELERFVPARLYGGHVAVPVGSEEQTISAAP